MGSCQNYGPLLGPLNTRYRIIPGTQEGIIILTCLRLAFERLDREDPDRPGIKSHTVGTHVLRA